jgi:hypothetical protein
MPWSWGLERQVEFDIDTVIFALRQEGCLTCRLMSSVQHVGLASLFCPAEGMMPP